MAVYSATIVADTLEAAVALRGMGLDLHERAARRRPDTGEIRVPAVLSDDEIQQVRAAGYSVTIEQDLEQVAPARLAEVNIGANRFAPAPRATAATREAAGETAALPTLESLMDLSDVDETSARAAERTVLGGYLTPDEGESALTTLAAAYPSLASVAPLREQTWEGRISHVLRLRAGSQAQRVGVLITGSMHAREWGGSDICVAFATNLLKSYTSGAPLKYGNKLFTAAQVKAMLEKLELFVFADVNPDGKNYSQSADPASGQTQGFWWRKNRNPNTGLPGGAKGVDINRNFDFLWSSGIGTSSDPRSFTYRGQRAFSEPECRNVRDVLDAYPHIGYYVDVHSFGELILFSWGDDENQSSDPNQSFLNPTFDSVRGVVGDAAYKEFIPAEDQATLAGVAQNMNAALRAVRGKSYTVEQAVGLYPTSATSDDYAFHRHRVNSALGKVYGFTIEFGQQFVPPYAEMRKIMADVAAAITELCHRVSEHETLGGNAMSDHNRSQYSSSSAESAELATQERRVVQLAASGEPEGDVRQRQEHLVQASMEFARALAGSDQAAFLQVFAAAFNVADTLASVPDQERREAALHLLNALEAGTRVTGSPAAMRSLAPRDAESIFTDPEYIANNHKLLREPQIILPGVFRIIGGVPTTDFSDCVAVGSEFRFCCTGTLVAPNVVVTAGHCHAGNCRSRIFIGPDITRPTTGRMVNVATAVLHPQYGQGKHNDLAVLILAQDVTNVQPRKMAPTQVVNAAKSFRLVGYGNTDVNSSGGFGLCRMVDVPRASDNPVFGADPGLEFVAGAPFLDKDSCNGDSGGPAYTLSGGEFLLAGATSRATKNSQRPCGDGGIYVRIDKYAPWIRSVPGGHWD
jgi:carboxypeptidase T